MTHLHSHPHPHPVLDDDARTWLDGLPAVHGDDLRTTTTSAIVDDRELATMSDRYDEDDAATVETAAITGDPPALGGHPTPTASMREYAYLVELHAPRRPAVWLAVRPTLSAARAVAAAIDPAVADAVIRELLLPCDENTLVDALAGSRLWSRDARGAWSTLPADADPAATLPIGSFR